MGKNEKFIKLQVEGWIFVSYLIFLSYKNGRNKVVFLNYGLFILFKVFEF